MKLQQVQHFDGGIYVFMIKEATDKEVANKIYNFFVQKGYKLESGTIMNGKYGIGSDFWRIILGAFAKRYLFNIIVTQQSDFIQVDFTRGMTGFSGGLIGIKKLDKEFVELMNQLSVIINIQR